MIGRAPELGRLRRLLTDDGGHGGALIVHGGAGVGKSSLLAAAAAEAREAGMLVLTVTGVQAEFGLPYAALRLLLSGLADDNDVAALLAGPDDGAYRIAWRVLDLLVATAEHQRLVLVVEDAQWLDRPSWDVLTFVGRRLAQDAVVLLAAIRDEADPGDRLRAVGIDLLAVGPLSDEDADALVTAHAPGLGHDLRARVVTEAAGNPLGLVELSAVASRYGADALLPAWLPLTTRLESVFGDTVAALPAGTRTLLSVAALDDGDSLPEILQAAAAVADGPLSPDDLDPAVAARVLVVDAADRVRFAHPLHRSAIRQACGLVLRGRIHAALAECVTDGDRRIWHRAAAALGPDDAIAHELEQSAHRYNHRSASYEAARAWERAARLSADPVVRNGRLVAAAFEYAESGDMAATSRLVAVIDESRLAPAARNQLAWLRETRMSMGWSGAARLVASADIALRMAADGQLEPAMHWLSSLGVRAWWSNPDETVRGAVVAAAEQLTMTPDEPLMLSTIALCEPVSRAAACAEHMRGLAGRTDFDSEQLLHLGTGALGIGAIDLARGFLDDAITRLTGAGRIAVLVQALNMQASAAVQWGDVRLGAAAAAQCRDLARESGAALWGLTSGLIHAQALALMGDGAAVAGQVDAAEEMFLAIGAHPMLALVQQARGLRALADGRAEEAYDHLVRIFDPADPAFHLYSPFGLLGYLADAGMRSDRMDAVRALYDEMVKVAAVSRSMALTVDLAYVRALLAGEDPAAGGLFEAALAGDAARWPWARARVLLAYGIWLRRVRQPAAARPMLRQAAGTFEALGIEPWAQAARRELRASGETLRRPTEVRERLTPQEMQIAQLAADGLSNRDIAARLFVSPRTISTHLYNVYPKLGVRSRAELAAALAGGAQNLRHLT
ncbi:LuxR family transcriptional regulator [Dactylosporangium darangshiense]|uniref:LuxR family transcriptional regulator n=2 Tax=Dactylosporangium darangshiense TaxID=579108 RepID=A0ABP8DHT7_9ACTN